MILAADFHRLVQLAMEARTAGIAGHPGAAREWLRLLLVEASKLDVALAGIQTAPPNHEQEIVVCSDTQ